MPKTETTKSSSEAYKRADAIFLLMKRLGFDPVADIRVVEDLENVLDREHDAAIEKAANNLSDIHPTYPDEILALKRKP